MDRVLRVLPKEEGAGRRGVIRNRPDVGEIVCDLVLSRRPQSEIAKRAGVDLFGISTEEDLVGAIVRMASLRKRRRQ